MKKMKEVKQIAGKRTKIISSESEDGDYWFSS